MMTTDMLRVAVIGAGYWGPNLTRNLKELGALALVCDVSTERLQAARDRFGVETTTSFAQVLENEAIDAVVIASPATTHYELALQSLESGKHAFVEKPLAMTASEAQALDACAKSRGLTLMVGHLLEYHPAFVAMKGLIRAGELGDILHIRCARLNLGRLRSEESVLWSFAPHDVSLVLRLAEREPDRVKATGLRLLGTPREDIVYADLAFDSGLSVHIQVSWIEPIKLHHFMVIGSKRMAVFNDVLPVGDKLKVYDKGFDQGPGGLKVRDGSERSVAYHPTEPMRTELEEFLDSCRTGKPPLADGPSGVRVVRTLERLTESMDVVESAHPFANLS